MKILEMACWYEYVHSNSNFLFVKVANFNTEKNVLNMHHKQSFLITDNLSVGDNILFIGEKTKKMSINRDEFLYFMYDIKTGVFSSDYSDKKDDQTIKRISGMLEKSIRTTEVEISESILSGSFIHSVDLSDKSLPKFIEPCKYHTIISNGENKGKFQKNASLVLKNCLILRDLLNYTM